MNPKHLLKRMHKKSLQSRAKFHVVAVGLSKVGNIIGIEMSHPVILGHVDNRHNPLGHAEWKLLCKYGKKLDTIYISRFSKTGIHKLNISACPMCSAYAKRMGVKIISLTNED